MPDSLKFRSASDKELFDLLMSAKQRMSEKALHSIALERGIIYSERSDREHLCDAISLLPHDYHSVVKLIDAREAPARQEKRTFTTLPVELDLAELDRVLNAYKGEPGYQDELTIHHKRATGVTVNIAYAEVDYSKTRLMQTTRRDTEIEFSFENGKTIIRSQSTTKADEVIAAITKKIEDFKRVNITPVSISLEGLSSEQRSRFFLALIKSLPEYRLMTVVNMRIASEGDDQDPEEGIDIDKDNDVAAPSQLVGRVNSIVLSGNNLLQSAEYQNLRRSGFYITSMTWQSEQQAEPRDVLQFDASFKRAREGTGFRFNARIARRLHNGNLTSDFKPLEVHRQPSVWRMIETASQQVLADIKANPPERGDTP
ncbi:hypothetical protein [Methylobacterium brachiatum]|uniref:hypothetical protein n=1 Tax=Methylobacterium brachiatum TaxID=269660 RepID=UPI0013CE80BA|nr:hypothetical protein [Methylobacterium brachiatum]